MAAPLSPNFMRCLNNPFVRRSIVGVLMVSPKRKTLMPFRLPHRTAGSARHFPLIELLGKRGVVTRNPMALGKGVRRHRLRVHIPGSRAEMLYVHQWATA